MPVKSFSLQPTASPSLKSSRRKVPAPASALAATSVRASAAKGVRFMVVSPVFSVLHFRTRRFAVRALTSHERDQVVIRFSTYELDVRAGELRKQGVRIKLQEQPFRILEMLLANPGQVVTPASGQVNNSSRA